jgi:hypothetical protein
MTTAVHRSTHNQHKKIFLKLMNATCEIVRILVPETLRIIARTFRFERLIARARVSLLCWKVISNFSIVFQAS